MSPTTEAFSRVKIDALLKDVVLFEFQVELTTK